MRKRSVALTLFAASLAFPAPDGATYRLLKKIPLAGEGGQDYLAVDENARRLYVSHGTQVEVIDIDKNAPVGKIGGMAGVHGIALAPKLNRGFITSGNTSTVKMFNLKTLESIADIPAGNGPDGAVFEPVTQRVFAFNHRGGTLTVIDAKEGKTIENIFSLLQPMNRRRASRSISMLAGASHGAVGQRSRIFMVFASIFTSVLLSSRLTQTVPLPSVTGNSGWPPSSMSVADADSGKVVATLPIGVHVDATAFDPATKLIFNANRGSVTIIHQDSAGAYSVVQTMEAAPRANTLAFDPKTHKIYLSASDYEQVPAGADSKARQKMVPNSFAVYVYGK